MYEPDRPVLQFRRTMQACTGQSPPRLCPDVYKDGHRGRFSSCRLLRQPLLRSSLAPMLANSAVRTTSSVHGLRARQKILVRHPDDRRYDRDHHGIPVDEPR